MNENINNSFRNDCLTDVDNINDGTERDQQDIHTLYHKKLSE